LNGSIWEALAKASIPRTAADFTAGLEVALQPDGHRVLIGRLLQPTARHATVSAAALKRKKMAKAFGFQFPNGHGPNDMLYSLVSNMTAQILIGRTVRNRQTALNQKANRGPPPFEWKTDPA